MPRGLGPVGHEDRLSIVDHLDELRSRLIVCAAALLVAFGICFWQNPALLRVLNRPLPASRPTLWSVVGGGVARVKRRVSFDALLVNADNAFEPPSGS